MEHIIITHNFIGDRKGYMFMLIPVYEHLNKEFNLKEIFFNENVNFFGAVPTSVSVDIYDDGRLIDLNSGEMENHIGTNDQVKIEGKKIRNICVF